MPTNAFASPLQSELEAKDAIMEQLEKRLQLAQKEAQNVRNDCSHAEMSRAHSSAVWVLHTCRGARLKKD